MKSWSNRLRKVCSILIAATLIFAVPAFADSATGTGASLAFDNAKWNYDATNDVYWQVRVAYCAAPQSTTCESLGIYVPGAYMTGTDNGDGTFTCALNEAGTVATYTAATAPIVIPVNTPGYAQCAAPTEFSYDSVKDYLTAGFIYVEAGMRGRANAMGGSSSTETCSGGAPWGVTDLKAAIRYLRYNKAALPGNTDNIYTFGMSGGGAQSALAGATGDSPLYTPYLNAIGAAMTDADGNALSDAVTGSMCWCPITSLDMADAAYEWNMGQFSSDSLRADASFGSALSDDLATEYANYINALKLKNGDTELTLTESSDGVYQAGSYYDYMLSVVETSLNNFLADTTFPYTATQGQQFPGGSVGNMGGAPQGATDATGAATDAATATAATNDAATATAAATDAAPTDNGAPAGMPAGGRMGPMGGTGTQTTYNTVEDYIASLNSDVEWVKYDSATNTATVTSLAAFAEHCKNATKSLGAFDEVDRGQGENNLFGDGNSANYHFDATLAKLLSDNADKYAALSDWDAAYATDAQADLAVKDELGTSMQTRVDMYNPMYFLNSYYQGYGTSTVAKYWRIRTGAFQSDTSLTVETNLALALQADSNVSSVDFATVWGMQHVMAERTGDSTTNFIAWVNECAAK